MFLSYLKRRPELIVCTLAGGAVLLDHPRLSGGLPWDLLQLFGYLGFALLLAATLMPGLGVSFRAHRRLGELSLLFIGFHVLGLLLYAPAVWYYLTSNAAGAMLVAVPALLLLLAVVLAAEPSLRPWFQQQPDRFRRWHQGFAVAAVLGCFWHVLGSSLYLGPAGRALLTVTTLLALLWPATRRQQRPALLLPLGVALLFAPLFLLLKLGN